jgi:hypothetical protein
MTYKQELNAARRRADAAGLHNILRYDNDPEYYQYKLVHSPTFIVLLDRQARRQMGREGDVDTTAELDLEDQGYESPEYINQENLGSDGVDNGGYKSMEGPLSEEEESSDFDSEVHDNGADYPSPSVHRAVRYTEIVDTSSIEGSLHSLINDDDSGSDIDDEQEADERSDGEAYEEDSSGAFLMECHRIPSPFVR